MQRDEDFVIMNDNEREEMMSGLEAQGISLGDHSKARRRSNNTDIAGIRYPLIRIYLYV